MEVTPDAVLEHGQARHVIDVADETMTFRTAHVRQLTLTGAQLAEAAGFEVANQTAVLRFLSNGELEDIRPDQIVELGHGEKRFIIVKSDRLFRFSLKGERFDWPCRVVSGAVIRKLGQIADDEELYLEQRGKPHRLIEKCDLVDLDEPGVEHFVARKQVWKLNVQGVILDLHMPTIKVREALIRAGFNPDQGWHIFLKVKGEPKRAVSLDDTVDLRTPGIEKLRLTPREVNNGEAPLALHHDFSLLPEDEAHLARLGLCWETILEANRRWLVIFSYPLPAGYTETETLLALEIPPTYPGAQIYGFYAHPPLALTSGRTIDNTQLRGSVSGKELHGWSRNRGSTPWNPTLDRIASQLALVDASLSKEVGE